MKIFLVNLALLHFTSALYLTNDEAKSILDTNNNNINKRVRRANDRWGREEWTRKSDFERECIQEECSNEELMEYMENFVNRRNSAFESYMEFKRDEIDRKKQRGKYQVIKVEIVEVEPVFPDPVPVNPKPKPKPKPKPESKPEKPVSRDTNAF